MPKAIAPGNSTSAQRAAGSPRIALGLMAGTSLDGVDAALVRLSGSLERPRVQLVKFVTVPYAAGLRGRLLLVAGGSPVSAKELSELNFRVGEAFARAALRVCREGGIDPRRLTVIGSHGQTVFHQGRAVGNIRPSTLQIGEPAVIAERTKAPVVADFRTADIAAGGEGAPLVPMVDYLLLRDERQGVIALNIGGIANLTVIPAGARPEEVYGFDTGPGNMVMDALVRRFTRGRRLYDAGGRLGAHGAVIEPVLAETLRFPFLRRHPPKSAGREEFGGEFVARYFLSRRPSARFVDLLRTAAELTARSISDALHRFVFPRLEPARKLHRLVISGGGAHNRLLVARIAALLPDLQVQVSDRYGLPVDAKEAMAFAVLAERTLHGLTGNLPSVTGAREPVVLGKLILGARLSRS